MPAYHTAMAEVVWGRGAKGDGDAVDVSEAGCKAEGGPEGG